MPQECTFNRPYETEDERGQEAKRSTRSQLQVSMSRNASKADSDFHCNC